MTVTNQKRQLHTVLLTISSFLAIALVYGFVSSLFIHVETVSVKTDVASPIRIVHLTDLHNAQFVKNNEKLVDKVTAQKPDIIIMSGDMLNEDDPNSSIIISLISDLSLIAPVYFGYGNHEKHWEKIHGQDLRPLLEQAGASVVDNDYIDLEFKGTKLRIGGYMAYYPVPHMSTHDETQQTLELAFAEDFENTNRLKILINHIPTGWVDWNYVNKYPVDIVFSGHYHGGMIRIPILNQGLYAPYVGLFPPFTKGVYTGQKATCILSAGLGIEHHIPRFYNPPEIMVVNLAPDIE